MTELSTMVELTGAELDAVAAGAPGQVAVQGGLVNVGNVNVDVEVDKNNIAILSGGAQVQK